MLEKLTSAEAQNIIVVHGTDEQTFRRYVTAVKIAHTILERRGVFIPEWDVEYVSTIIRTVTTLSGDARVNVVRCAKKWLYTRLQDVAPAGTYFGPEDEDYDGVTYRFQEIYWD